MFWTTSSAILMAIGAGIFALCHLLGRHWFRFAWWIMILSLWCWIAYVRSEINAPPTIDCYEGMTLLPKQSCVMHINILPPRVPV